MDKRKLINEFKETFLPGGFKWRKGQQDAIIKILEAYENGYEYVILDSPVGSGKSILAMCVSWILNQYSKKGYILASDVALQEQYESDFNRFNLNWGSVKGIDNYICVDNMEKNSLGTCRIQNMSPRKFPCYGECPYFSNRDKASETSTSLLNYAYWLIMMNYVNAKEDEEDKENIFQPRDFLICDEGHKVLDIVQNHYSPKFDKETIDKIKKLSDFFDNYKVRDHTKNFNKLKVSIKALWETDNVDKLFDLLTTIEANLETYIKSITLLKEKVKREYSGESPPKEWRNALNLSDWLKDLHCKVEDYVNIIESTSTGNLIKNPQGKDKLIFNCLEENYLMHKYFHKWSKFTIFMSATFADPKDYAKDISLKSARYIKVANSFDFSKSPIYFYNKRKMSYKYINDNLPWLYSKINDITNKHKGENGIIHTASYDLAMKIFENVNKETRKRLLIYNGTKEKKEVLLELKKSKDKILIGPSILEGLDLKNNWSRFAIFAKVPFMSLGDAFVNAKKNINPSWYRFKAILNILQGVGRTVRNEDDWAVTYILDASLIDLIHNNRSAFPSEFIQRLQIIRE
ncbi:MAG: helicase C-terminal domain-containing protein [bacterium]